MSWASLAAFRSFKARSGNSIPAGIDGVSLRTLRPQPRRDSLGGNWECSVRQLRLHAPDTGRNIGIDGKGFITANEWHDIHWEIRPASMRLTVDGELRFEGEGSWGQIQAPVGIGPCFGSTLTVRSFVVG